MNNKSLVIKNLKLNIFIKIFELSLNHLNLLSKSSLI
jgi:hypothetical protein